jgi:tRNA (mo5U34)-methyltransferase
MEFPSEILEIIKERSEWINNKNSEKYKNILNDTPELNGDILNLDTDAVEILSSSVISHEDLKKIKNLSEALIPWRKGPFKIFDLEINSEWRSNLKWDRIKPHLPNLEGKNILDIGANNGYYMFRMAASNPKLILGIDPVVHNYAQFNFLQKFAKISSLRFELLGIEHLKFFKEFFDVIFSMGIIYHHKNPIEQLQDIRNALKPSGTVILESIGIPGENPMALFPHGSYAKMSNVWFIPTISCMFNWAHKAKFKNIEIISSSKMTLDEQRNTPWCPKPFQSLEDFLDPNDRDKTIEGYPAPMRFCLSLKK